MKRASLKSPRKRSPRSPAAVGGAEETSLTSATTSSTVVCAPDAENIILTQNQFVENLMSRRHDFALWKQIENVTAILSEGHGKYDTFRFRYIDIEHNNALNERCKDYVLQLLDDYRPEHVLADKHMQKESSKRNITECCLRQAYKFVWFHEIFRQQHISKALFIFVKFKPNHYYLLDARNIHYRKSDPRNIRRYYVQRLNLRDPEYEKRELAKIMSDAYMEDEAKNEQVVRKLKQLNAIYEQDKRDINLDLYKVEPKDTRSDEVFALFHPELKEMNIHLTDLTENNNVELAGVKEYFRSLYGDPLCKKSTSPYIKSKPLSSVQIWNSNPQSAYRINSANCQSIRHRLNKGERYDNPFEKKKLERKRNLLQVCVKPVHPQQAQPVAKRVIQSIERLKEQLESSTERKNPKLQMTKPAKVRVSSDESIRK